MTKSELVQHLGAEIGQIDARPCDKVVLTFFTPSHLLLQFSGLRQPASQIMGFGGYLLNNTTMEIHSIYRHPMAKEDASEGHCLFTFRDTEMTGITCIGKTGRGPALVSLFEVSPGQ